MPFFDDTSFADIPLKQMPTSFFSMVYFPKGVATVMWCLVFSTTPYTVPDEACFTCSATLFTAFATSVLSLFAKLVVVAVTAIINEIIIFFILYIKRVILHFPRSTNHSLLSLPDYEHKSKKIISISQISKPTLYEMPFCMYQMTKRRGGISLNYSWHITVGLRMHITCCASAYQLLCKRTTAVVRPEILTNSKTYTIFSNNLYYVFQQHISNIPTNKKG